MQSPPEGVLLCAGRLRLLGYKEPPPTELAAPKSAGNSGVELTLEPGRFGWCSCGYSERQPFCDDSHRLEENATNRKSYKFEVLETVTVKLCLCKATADPPFCDGTCDQ